MMFFASVFLCVFLHMKETGSNFSLDLKWRLTNVKKTVFPPFSSPATIALRAKCSTMLAIKFVVYFCHYPLSREVHS